MKLPSGSRNNLILPNVLFSFLRGDIYGVFIFLFGTSFSPSSMEFIPRLVYKSAMKICAMESNGMCARHMQHLLPKESQMRR